MKRTRSLSLILSLLLLLSSCTAAPTVTGDTDTTAAATEAVTDAPSRQERYYLGDYPALLETDTVEYHSARPATAEAGTGDARIDGTELLFVSDEIRATWREPLARLLSNIYQPIVEDYDIVGYAPLDPTRPALPRSSACALTDVTMDGVPELMVFPYGYAGSAGGATQFAYDIFTGESVAVLSGGADTYDPYYCLRDGRIYLLSEYSLRAGATGGCFAIAAVACMEDDVWSEEVESLHVLYQKSVHLLAEYEIDGDPTQGIPPSRVHYSICGGKVDAGDYYYELRFLHDELIPIPEVRGQLCRWSDVADHLPEDDYAARGAAMADALLALDQEFLRFE